MFKYPKKEDNAPGGSPFAGPEDLSPWGNPAPQQQDQMPVEGGYFGGAEAAASPFDSAPASSAPEAMPTGSTRNVLNSDVSVVGILRFTDDLLVDGSVEGEITSDGELTVGANASIQAGEKNKVAVNTKSAIIHGRVMGDVVVTDRVVLAATAHLVGDVTAARISIQEGAVFVGHCRVGEAPATAPAPKKAVKAAAKGGSPNLLG